MYDNKPPQIEKPHIARVGDGAGARGPSGGKIRIK